MIGKLRARNSSSHNVGVCLLGHSKSQFVIIGVCGYQTMVSLWIGLTKLTCKWVCQVCGRESSVGRVSDMTGHDRKVVGLNPT